MEDAAKPSREPGLPHEEPARLERRSNQDGLALDRDRKGSFLDSLHEVDDKLLEALLQKLGGARSRVSIKDAVQRHVIHVGAELGAQHVAVRRQQICAVLACSRQPSRVVDFTYRR